MKNKFKLLPARLLAAWMFVALLGLAVYGSSHREAPLIRHFAPFDNTDVYAFVSPDNPGTITLISLWYGFQEPNGGPNFYGWPENVEFKIYLDNDGDAEEEVVIECTFYTDIRNKNTFLYNTGPIMSLNDPNWNMRQFFDFKFKNRNTGLKFKVKDLAVPPDNIGPVSIPNYDALAAEAIHDLGNGFKVFAGQRDDPFYVDLGAVFDLLTIRPGVPGNIGGGVDGLAGFNVNAIVVQAPISAFTKDGSTPTDPNDPEAVLGIWSTTEVEDIEDIFNDSPPKPKALDDFFDESSSRSSSDQQVSRLGMPLVNELVIPLRKKNKFNRSEPEDDSQFLDFVLNPEPAALLNLIYGLSVPPTPRNDFVTVFLTGVPGLNQPPGVEPAEMLRLNVAIPPSPSPNPLGVIAGDIGGFPNGRRLEDDVVDIALRVTAGVLVPGFNIFPNNALGDGVDVNDIPFLSTFPYLAAPHQGFEHEHHRIEPPHSPGITAGMERLKGNNKSGDSGIQNVPADLKLEQNYPNPFNPATTIQYRLPETADVKIRVYNVRGELVRTLIDENMPAGYHSVQWNATNDRGNRVASGLYFYRMETPQFVKARNMILLK